MGSSNTVDTKGCSSNVWPVVRYILAALLASGVALGETERSGSPYLASLMDELICVLPFACVPVTGAAAIGGVGRRRSTPKVRSPQRRFVPA